MLFKINKPKPKEEKIIWTELMLKAKEYLPEDLILTFAYFPNLLIEVIKEEIREPDIKYVIKSIYKAVRSADLKSYLYFHSKFNQVSYIYLDEEYIRKALLAMLHKQRKFTFWDVKLMKELGKEISLISIIITMDEFRQKNLSD